MGFKFPLALAVAVIFISEIALVVQALNCHTCAPPANCTGQPSDSCEGAQDRCFALAGLNDSAVVFQRGCAYAANCTGNTLCGNFTHCVVSCCNGTNCNINFPEAPTIPPTTADPTTGDPTTPVATSSDGSNMTAPTNSSAPAGTLMKKPSVILYVGVMLSAFVIGKGE